jgi:hypothetical protein
MIVSPQAATSPNYAVWLLVIVLGVTGGNLLSTWLIATDVEHRVQLAAREAAKAMQASTERAARVRYEALAQAESERLAALLNVPY